MAHPMYATWDSASHSEASIGLTEGDLRATRVFLQNGLHYSVRSTLGVSSGKYYWEITVVGSQAAQSSYNIGIAESTLSQTNYPGQAATGYSYRGDDNYFNNAGAGGNAPGVYVVGDVIGVALDMDNLKCWWSLNGVFDGSPAAGTGGPIPSVFALITPGTYYAAISLRQVADPELASMTANFGATAFAYTPPTGFTSGLFVTMTPVPILQIHEYIR